MTNTNFARQLTAIVATLLVSSTCLLAAVGPATGNGGSSAPVAARTLA